MTTTIQTRNGHWFKFMLIEISTAEVIDKYTIIEIKLKQITDQNKLNNIEKEYLYLKSKIALLLEDAKVFCLYIDLKAVNSKLWTIEDEIRIKEKNQEFDEEFVQLARQVYTNNDLRYKIKQKINIICYSNFIEEKSYEFY